MSNKCQQVDALLQEIKQLRRELAEANSTLNAIKHGEVDALLISNNLGDQVFVLKGADHIYRVIVEEMQEGYATIASDGTILFCNKNFADIIKTPLERIIGLSIYGLLKPLDEEAFACFLSSRKESFKAECSFKTGDRLYAPVIISASNITIEGDTITCLVITDLTEQRRSQRFMKMIFNQTKEPVIVCDRYGRIIQINPSSVSMLGNQLIGNDFNVAIPMFLECDGTRFRLKQALDSNSSYGVEVRLVRCDGKKLNLIINAGRFDDEDDESIIGCVVTLTDITSQRQLDVEMARIDRFNLIGEMAVGIGHEIRNPLTTVRGYLQLFQRNSKYADHREQFTTMIEELDRANLIITEFISLAKDKRVELKPGNLNDIIHALFPLLQAGAFHLGHEIQTDIGDIPTICYDDKEMRQLILNIVRNGLEAMPSKGVITIKTYATNDHLILEIRDTGTGVLSSVLDKLGTPFVTTKDNGIGLGLPICYRIAERHNAKIEIETSPIGTAVIVKFIYNSN